MKVYEYQQLLGFMYREDYKEDPIIAKILIEGGQLKGFLILEPLNPLTITKK